MTRSGVVLAGGAGERMGGVDKALVPHRGRPLIEHVVDALLPHSDEIVVARGSRPPIRGMRCVPDEGAGPASGLRAGALAARGAWVLVAPCDAPHLTSALYARLIDAAAGRDGSCVVVEGHLNALVGAYARIPLLAALEGVTAPRDALARLDVARVEARAAEVADVDTREELAAIDRAEREASSARGRVHGS